MVSARCGASMSGRVKTMFALTLWRLLVSFDQAADLRAAVNTSPGRSLATRLCDSECVLYEGDICSPDISCTAPDPELCREMSFVPSRSLLTGVCANKGVRFSQSVALRELCRLERDKLA